MKSISDYIFPTYFNRFLSQKTKVAPTIMPFTFGEDSFSPGDSTGVQCIVTKGDSPVQIGWLFNNETLKNGQNGVNIINISAKTSLLNIASINDMNRGVYVCQAKNLAGIAEDGSELKVNGTKYYTKQHKIQNNRNYFL